MGVAGLAAFICWIMVLIKMFKTQESPLMGIIGIFCTIWAYIWGWMNASKYNLKKIMLLWTVSIIVSLAGYGMFMAGIVKMAEEQGVNFEPMTTPVVPMEPVVEPAP